MIRHRTLVVDDAGEIPGALHTIADATEAVAQARVDTTAGGVVDAGKRLHTVLAATETGLLDAFDDALQGSQPS